MDLLLDFGDLSIEKVETGLDDNSFYDLVLESEETFIAKLIRRTLETPLGYIKLAIQNRNSIDYLDKDYGNLLYKKLSEPLTMSFILEAQTDIELALNSIRDIEGLTFSKVIVSNFTITSLDIEVNYTYNGKNINSQLVLNL